jgi:hypothetical protein
MRVLNNNPLDLQGDNGETISVSISASNTVNSHTNNLNGAPLAGNSFVLDKNVANPYVLLIFVIFSGSSGGLYDITVTGSNGGTSQYSIHQYSGQASNAIAYSISIS